MCLDHLAQFLDQQDDARTQQKNSVDPKLA